MSFSRSYSRRLFALYTWNSPLPAPALLPCTFFIISRGGRIVFSFGGAGTGAGFAGSFSSRASCARCRSTAVSACLFTGGVASPAEVGVGVEVEAMLPTHAHKRPLTPAHG